LLRGVQLPFQAAVTSLLDQRRILRRPRSRPAAAGKVPVELPAGLWTASIGKRRTPCTLLTIAPKRFNPDGKAWLPILHTSRGSWHFTALYSNTVLAHERYKNA
jgi:putative hydrolase